MEAHMIAWLIGAGCVLLAVFVAFHLVFQHLSYYFQPEIQRYIVRIIFMVPVYAISSWLSLRFKSAATYLDTVRDIYEAYALYSFYCLMLAYLGGEERIVKLKEGTPAQTWPRPFFFLNPFYPDAKWLRLIRRGTLQFALVKPICGVLSLIFEWTGLWESGKWTTNNAWPYITIIDNISITLAMYYLIAFYYVMRDLLKPFDPWPKFITIKSVIFATFWQKVLLSFLVMIKVIHDVGSWTAEDVTTGFNNFLICFEMALAAFAHEWAFPYKPFREQSRTHMPLLHGIKDAVDHRDMIEHTKVFLPARFKPGPVKGDTGAGGDGDSLGGDGVTDPLISGEVEVEVSPAPAIQSEDGAENVAGTGTTKTKPNDVADVTGVAAVDLEIHETIATHSKSDHPFA